jgi:hypothetical protein
MNELTLAVKDIYSSMFLIDSLTSFRSFVLALIQIIFTTVDVLYL